MAEARQGEGSGSGDMATMVVGIILLTAAVLAISYLFWNQIVMALFGVTWLWMKITAPFAGLLVSPQDWAWSQTQISDVLRGAAFASDVSLDTLSATLQASQNAVRPLVVLIFGAMAFVVWKWMPGDRITRRYKLKTLAEATATHWHYSKPAAQFNPDDKDAQVAPGMRPLPWMANLGAATRDENGQWRIETQPTQGRVTLDINSRDKVEKGFAAQLGPTWKTLDQCRPYEKLMFAVFATHADSVNYDAKDSRKHRSLELRKAAANIFVSGKSQAEKDKALEELVRPILEDSGIMDNALAIADEHGYVSTALMRLLAWCRPDAGVLPTAEMVWLKRIDRDLWYALNWVGRRVSFVESAGTVSHYNFERLRRQPVLQPKVDKAIEAIEEYLEYHQIV